MLTLIASILNLALIIALLLVARKALKRHRKKMRRMHGPSWSIGLYAGPDPFTLRPIPGREGPILKAVDITDVDARLVADPFMVKQGSTYHLFFEMMNKGTNKGDIGHASSTDLNSWQYGGTVLSEPFHLSYPYVFQHEEKTFMIPEAGKSGGIHLYEAERFPDRWNRTATILEGEGRSAPLQDPSVIRHEGRWYLFSYAPEPRNCHLFVADTLEGPWKEHPKSPIVTASRHYARPGGRVILYNGNVYRYSQDSVPSYGSKVWAFRISELTPTTYREEAASDTPVITGGTEPWNNEGMHTVDPHQLEDGSWIAIVDGIGNGKRVSAK